MKVERFRRRDVRRHVELCCCVLKVVGVRHFPLEIDLTFEVVLDCPVFVNCRVECGDDVVVVTANKVVNVDIRLFSHPDSLFDEPTEGISADVVWIDVSTCPTQVVAELEQVRREMSMTTTA